MKWLARKFYKETLKIGDGKETSKKIKLFLYSILIGVAILVAFLFVIGDNNPFTAFNDSLKNLSLYTTSRDKVMVNIAILGLAGTAVAIGFKTGLFNIGVSGQMMFGGMLAGMLAIHMKDSMPPVIGQISILIIAVLGASLFGTVSGILKTYFGIHEVVSTILLNWIAFFLFRGALTLLPDELLVDGKDATKAFGDNFTFKYNISTFAGAKAGGIVALGLFLATAAIMWFMITKTSFGQKLMIVGKNKEAALASGINVKAISISSMAISGAIAGVLAIVVYFVRENALPSSKVMAIPAEGFNGLAIAILSFSNPIATIPVAVIFGLINAMVLNTTMIDQMFVPVITGVLMAVAAMNILFVRFNVYQSFRKLIMPKSEYQNYIHNVEHINDIDTKYYEKYSALKISYIDKRRATSKAKRNALKDDFNNKKNKLISIHDSSLEKNNKHNKTIISKLPKIDEKYNLKQEELKKAYETEKISQAMQQKSIDIREKSKLAKEDYKALKEKYVYDKKLLNFEHKEEIISLISNVKGGN